MTATNAASSIISLLIDEVRQSLEPKILHILADYQTYKETHDAMLQIPFVKHLLENQCRCNISIQPAQSTDPETVNAHEPIHLEIIEKHAHGLQNLDSISEYINSTIESSASEAESEAEEAEAEAESESEAAQVAAEEADAESEAESEAESD